MSKHLFYFGFEPSAFIVGTMGFNNTQKGIYITLLCLQFEKGPLELSLIQSISEGVEEDIQKVLTKFKKNRKGLYYNERLEKTRKKAKDSLQSSSDYGKKGAKARWSNKKGPNRDPIKDPNGNASNSEHSDPLDNTIEPKPYETLDELYKELGQ